MAQQYKIETGTLFFPFQVYTRREIDPRNSVYSVDNPWRYLKGFETAEKAQKFIDESRKFKVGEIQ